MVSAGLGLDIASSIVTGDIQRSVDATINAMRAGDLSLLLEGAFSLVVPKDVDILNRQQVEGKSYDSKGTPLDTPDRGSVLNQLGAISKNLPTEYKKDTKLDVLEVDKVILDKYGKMDITEFLDGDNITDLVDIISTSYPNSNEKKNKVLGQVLERIVTPEKSKLYNKIGKDSKELLALPDEAIKDYPTLKRLTKKEIVKITAQAMIFEPNIQTVELLIKAGVLDLTDESVFNNIIQEMRILEESPLKDILLDTNTEDEE
jgi:hypothetical protein